MDPVRITLTFPDPVIRVLAVTTDAAVAAEATRRAAADADLQAAIDSIVAGSLSWGTINGDLADQEDLQTALDGKSATDHTHTIADITGEQSANTVLAGPATGSPDNPTFRALTIADTTGLQTALDGKSATGHTHAISDTTGLQTALDGKSATGHGHTISDTTGLQTALDGKSATGHGHTIADTTGLQTALNDKQPLDAELTALAALTSAADTLPYFTGLGAAALATLTAAARTFLAAVDAAAQRNALGLAIGTDVQAYSATLATWSGITPGTGVATALAIAVGGTGSFITNGGALGTPFSGNLAGCTGLPISTGVSGLGTGIATALATATGSTGAPALLGGAGSFTTLAASGTLTIGTTTSQITGAAGDMTITAGTGNSRQLIFKTTSSGGTATTALTLGSDQSATFAATVTSSARITGQHIRCAAGGYIEWGPSRSTSRSTTNGVITISNDAETTGVSLDFTTDSLLKIRNRANSADASITTANATLSGYLAGAEMTAPAAPAANGYRIYAEDNGSGKTRLMVLFASGAAQQIAIEP